MVLMKIIRETPYIKFLTFLLIQGQKDKKTKLKIKTDKIIIINIIYYIIYYNI